MARRRRRKQTTEGAAPNTITKRVGGRVNLENVCKFLQIVSLRQLDGLHQALTAKLADLGIEPNRKSHKSFPLDGGSAPTGNLRGVLTWVENATEDEDAEALQTVLAVVQARFNAAGYKPKVDTGEGQALT